jgi:hypothetical protein
LAAARAILEKLLDQEPEDMEIPEQDRMLPEVANVPRSENEDLSCEVWTGTDSRLAVFLIEALHENDIPTHAENAAGETRIFVTPSSETRAREIIHEIRDATPPA